MDGSEDGGRGPMARWTARRTSLTHGYGDMADMVKVERVRGTVEHCNGGGRGATKNKIWGERVADE